MSDSWFKELLPASFRGVSFSVLGSGGQFGRKTAEHEYPYKEENNVWVEDLGLGTRRFRITGFLVGDDVIAQRRKLIRAAETKGAGLLVHPTYGELKVSIPEGGLVFGEQRDQGRCFEFSILCTESGSRHFPTVATATKEKLLALADEADKSALESFVDEIEGTLSYGASVVNKVTDLASSWARQAQRLVNDATSLKNMVSTLEGSYGRYFGGRTKGFKAVTNAVTGTSNTVKGLLSVGALSRAHVGTVANSLTSLASDLGLSE